MMRLELLIDRRVVQRRERLAKEPAAPIDGRLPVDCRDGRGVARQREAIERASGEAGSVRHETASLAGIAAANREAHPWSVLKAAGLTSPSRCPWATQASM